MAAGAVDPEEITLHLWAGVVRGFPALAATLQQPLVLRGPTTGRLDHPQRHPIARQFRAGVAGVEGQTGLIQQAQQTAPAARPLLVLLAVVAAAAFTPITPSVTAELAGHPAT